VKANGRVFVLDDDDLIVSMLARSLKREGYQVQAETDPGGVVEKIRSFSPHVVLLDIKLPGVNGLDVLRELAGGGTRVVMLTSDDSAESAVRAMKVGAVDYLTKPFDLEEVKKVIAAIIEEGSPRHEPGYLRTVSSDRAQVRLIGTSAAVSALKESAEKLAKARVPSVLITGESGTGKELVARYIHDSMHSGDSSAHAPFIGINCAALPEDLVESELFGHEKGAFTDAKVEKVGIFELAAGGTVLLDEIGEMKWNLQAKLLRALEEWKVRRVGGRIDIPIQATVFVTTNRNLEEAVKTGDFRIDLFYRLATFCLHVPPLREHREDVIPIAEHYLGLFAAKYSRPGPTGFSAEAARLLRAHDWPGNVRELRNTIERLVVLESGPTVLPEHLPKVFRRESASGHTSSGEITLPDAGLSLEDLESTLIVQALTKTGRNKVQAAKLLGITYDSLRYQVKKLGLD